MALSVINPGDEVIIPTPAWVSYMEQVKLAGGISVEVPSDINDNFKLTPEKLEKAITPKTKMLIICTPSNPSGIVYSPEELQALVDVLVKYPEIVILSDEIYQHINYTGVFKSLGAFQEIADRTIVVNGVSKAYAMTGWRIGFIAAPDQFARACAKLQSQISGTASTISQKAAEAAYRGPQQCVEDMRLAFLRRRDLIMDLISEIPGMETNTPEGAFYIFPKVTHYIGMKYPGGVIESSGDLTMYLLEKAHVATVDGAAFCMPGYIRISYATSDDNIREAMRRIREALALLS